MTIHLTDFDPKLDLRIERVIDVPRKLVWEAWTTPELMENWFCPKPWVAKDFTLDLRAGGAFACTMYGPNGERFPNLGCYLEVVPEQRLIWTDTMVEGMRPAASPMMMTAHIELADEGSGTRYRATVYHGSVETRAKHEEMGFSEGWNTALDQLVEVMQGRG